MIDSKNKSMYAKKYVLVKFFFTVYLLVCLFGTVLCFIAVPFTMLAITGAVILGGVLYILISKFIKQ